MQIFVNSLVAENINFIEWLFNNSELKINTLFLSLNNFQTLYYTATLYLLLLLLFLTRPSPLSGPHDKISCFSGFILGNAQLSIQVLYDFFFFSSKISWMEVKLMILLKEAATTFLMTERFFIATQSTNNRLSLQANILQESKQNKRKRQFSKDRTQQSKTRTLESKMR